MVNITDILKDTNWESKDPASADSIQRLVAEAGKELPEAYLALLGFSDGGEGSLDLEPGWLQLWSSDAVLEHNRDYEIEENIPGFFGIGTNGGGELLAIDTRSGGSGNVVMIPFIPMSAKEAIVIASSFEEFIRAIGRH